MMTGEHSRGKTTALLAALTLLLVITAPPDRCGCTQSKQRLGVV